MRLRPGAPVLARTTTELQVGLRRPVVLSTLTPAQVDFVCSLEGGRNVGAREARLHADLLDTLGRGSMLAPEAAPTAAVRFHGAGAIAVEAATVLARLGWSVAFVDRGRARDHGHGAPVATGSSVGMLAAQRVRTAVADATVHGADAPADLDVLITVGIPVTVQRALLTADAPHLIVACDERGATVGPVVTPGNGPCAQCLGLHHTDRDHLWPRIVLQCETRRPRMDPLTAGLAGMLVARLASDFASGARPSMWRVDDEGVVEVSVPDVHPDCGCSAP